MASRETTPFLLTGSASTLAGAPGIFPSLNLINSLQVPIEITELHFMVTSTDGGEDDILSVEGGEISLQAGRHIITNGFAPLMTLTPLRENNNNESVFDQITASTFRWVLPRPLILKSGEGISGAYRLSTTVFQGQSTATIVARGRRMPSNTRIARRCVAFASGAFFTAANVPAASGVFQNPFQVPLKIRSINAQTINDAQPLGAATTATITGPGGLVPDALRSLAVNVMGSGIFAGRYALEIQHDLNPRDAYQIVLNQTPGEFSPVAIGIMGYREEEE